jgi:spore germination protein GerM
MQVTPIQKRFIYVVTGVFIVLGAAYILLNLDDEGNFPRGGIPILLYYYNPDLDQGPGGVQCSEKGLVAVERMIPRSKTQLRDTIHLLIEGRLSKEERDRGITTEFPLAEFSILSADIRDNTAFIAFLDPLNQTTGGACRVSILRAQIEATAKQFPTVHSVRIEPDTLFQP